MHVKRIELTEGIKLWNNLLVQLTGIIPFVYNPALFGFYERHFTWKPYYIIFTSNNKPCCILPIIKTKKAWVSLPHFSHGGLLYIDGEADIRAPILIRSAIIMFTGKEPGFFTFAIEEIEKIEENVADFYFIRTSQVVNTGEFVKTEKAVSIIKLANDHDLLWSQLSHNLRRKINKAKNNLTIVTGNEELVGDFYKVYTKNISQLGSMTYGLGFFRDLISCTKDNNDTIFLAYFNDILIGAALLASWGNHFENLYFAAQKEYRNTYVSDYLHWEMIKYCINKINDNKEEFNSQSIYSFGRSTINSGVYNYKNHWPVENQELYNFTNITDARNNKKLLSIWKLLPQFITIPLGSRLIKDIY